MKFIRVLTFAIPLFSCAIIQKMVESKVLFEKSEVSGFFNPFQLKIKSLKLEDLPMPKEHFFGSGLVFSGVMLFSKKILPEFLPDSIAFLPGRKEQLPVEGGGAERLNKILRHLSGERKPAMGKDQCWGVYFYQWSWSAWWQWNAFRSPPFVQWLLVLGRGVAPWKRGFGKGVRVSLSRTAIFGGGEVNIPEAFPPNNWVNVEFWNLSHVKSGFMKINRAKEGLFRVFIEFKAEGKIGLEQFHLNAFNASTSSLALWFSKHVPIEIKLERKGMDFTVSPFSYTTFFKEGKSLLRGYSKDRFYRIFPKEASLPLNAQKSFPGLVVGRN